MSRLLRTIVVYCFLLMLASCGGGGCSSCAGGAIHPIAGGYALTPERRIPHAIQVRLSDQGLHSVEAIAPSLFAGFLGSGFAVPTTSVTGITICDRPPAGGCRINVSLSADPAHRGLELGFVPPNQISAKIRLILVDHNLPIHTVGCDLHIDLDTTRSGGGHAFVGLETNIAILRDSHNERLDYFRADLVSATSGGSVVQEIPGEGVESNDFTIVNDTGGIPGIYCSAISGLADALRPVLVGQISGQLQSALGPIQDALSQTSTPDPPGCPTGTTASGGHCYYPGGTDSAHEVPTLLGTDGTGNFGRLVGSVTPGVIANDSYVIAAGDHDHNAEVPDTTGMTVNVFGAITSDGHNTCVPRLPTPAIPTVAEWHTLRQNIIPGGTAETDLGIGVSEEFLNSTLWNLWDSGMFCLGVTTRMSQQLSTGLFGALPQLSSLRNVVFPARSSSVALVLRPQQPPTIHIGSGADATHPLMTLTFTQLSIDFYAWSEERYVRFLTVNTDMAIPINLMPDASGAIRPVLGTAMTSNTTVTNAGLLNAMPAQIATVLGPLLGTAIGMFAGNVPPVNLPTIPLPGAGGTAAGAVQIQLPATGIQGVDESGARFLGLFANLVFVPPHPEHIQLDTAATFEYLPFDHAVYQFRPDFTEEQLPHVRLHLSTPNSFGHDVEYTYRIDDLTWSQWTRETTVDVTSPSFFAQGAHHAEIRARIVNAADSVDTEPARVDFTIDTVAPTAVVSRQDHQLQIEGHDDVLPAERLQFNVSFDGATSAEWSTTSHYEIPAGATAYDVRVRDEQGNETLIHGDVTALTIRGGPSSDPSSGCGCSAPGSRTDGVPGILGAIGAILFSISLLRRRNRREQQLVPVRVQTRAAPRRAPVPRILLWAMVPSFFVALGCNCGQHPTTDAGHPDAAPTCDGGHLCGGHCVTATSTCDHVCPSYQSATGMPTFDMATCMWQATTTTCACQDNAPLPQGMAGSFLDMSVATDNTVWFSSYSSGDPRSQQLYGDLIVGTYDRNASHVNWTQVDGVPTGVDPTSPPTTWRGGVAGPGDDVGRWNSMALDSTGHPRVAYWDTTHDHLKFAYFDGTTWHVSVVDPTGHNGRYASLVMLAGNIPAIAYRATVPDPAMAGHILAKVRYARASNATPNGATDWTITDVASAPTSCRASDCATGQACLRTGVCAATGAGCPAACSASQACVMSTCQDIYTTNWIEDFVPGIGLFNSLRTDAMGQPQLVFYDRDRGNLMGAHITSGTTWATFIIDGENPDGSDISDRGAWATLAVATDGTWNVGYVDGWTENVMFARVMNGVRMGAAETVDDGAGVGATPFTDGDHVIGDSAEVDIDSTGVIRMVYQDSTSGTLRLAQRGTMGWTVTVQDMMNSTGYWSRIEHGQIGTFFRDLSHSTPTFGVRVFAAH